MSHDQYLDESGESIQWMNEIGALKDEIKARKERDAQ